MPQTVRLPRPLRDPSPSEFSSALQFKMGTCQCNFHAQICFLPGFSRACHPSVEKPNCECSVAVHSPVSTEVKAPLNPRPKKPEPAMHTDAGHPEVRSPAALLFPLTKRTDGARLLPGAPSQQHSWEMQADGSPHFPI